MEEFENAPDIPPPISHDIPLATLAEAKEEYARIYNQYAQQKIVRDRARTMGYLLSSMLALFKLEQDREILARIEALEERLEKNE